MFEVIIDEKANTMSELATLLRSVASFIENGEESGNSPAYRVLGKEVPKFTIDSLAKFNGEKMFMRGLFFTFYVDESMSGRIGVWQSETFEHGTLSYKVYATPEPEENNAVMIDIKLLIHDGKDVFETEPSYVNACNYTIHGGLIGATIPTDYEEYREVVRDEVEFFIRDFEESKDAFINGKKFSFATTSYK